jgi:hypothetical protein
MTTQPTTQARVADGTGRKDMIELGYGAVYVANQFREWSAMDKEFAQQRIQDELIKLEQDIAHYDLCQRAPWLTAAA